MSQVTFEEVIDASKNVHLEMQRKHGINIQIIRQELIPQNIIQKLFSRPKIRVVGNVMDAYMIPNSESVQIGQLHSLNNKTIQSTQSDVDIHDITHIFKQREYDLSDKKQSFLQKEIYNPLLQIYDILRENDFSTDFVHLVKEHISENYTLQNLRIIDKEKIILTVLKNNLVFYDAKKNISENQRIITLVGPTGTGKTTAISKLAVQLFIKKYVKKNNSEKQMNLRIVSLDSFKIGAIDQIEKIADVLTVPCECVHDEDELRKYARKGARPEILLVDTTGKNPKEIENQDDIYLMLNVLKKRNEVFLVVDATMSSRNLEYVFQSFATYSYNGVIITKLDEAQSIGEILSACIKYKVPIAYLGAGQDPSKGMLGASMKNLCIFLHIV